MTLSRIFRFTAVVAFTAMAGTVLACPGMDVSDEGHGSSVVITDAYSPSPSLLDAETVKALKRTRATQEVDSRPIADAEPDTGKLGVN